MECNLDAVLLWLAMVEQYPSILLISCCKP